MMEDNNINSVANTSKIDDNDNHDADTATESYDDEDYDDDESSDNSQYSYQHQGDRSDNNMSHSMPPLKYARIMGSLPRDNNSSNESNNSTAFSIKSTCSTMGRVIVRPSQLPDKGNSRDELPSTSRHGDNNTNNIGGTVDWNDDDEADISITKVHHVLALGFEDGKVRLVDVLTGGSVLFGSSDTDGGAWFVNTSASKQRGNQHIDAGQRIVSLSFDSSATYLCAMNGNGDAAIFGPLIWGKQQHVVRTSADFTLVKPPASTVRFSYADSQSFGSTLLGGGTATNAQGNHPTCMVLDPAYARRKERALIVGFDDGRLILSKLQGIGSGITSLFGGGGGTTVKKIDSVLYQGMGATSFPGDQAGIEAVTWRGGLVAWADSSGVRLFDIEAMSRIAHIDRPTGARGSLYPTISSLHPSIMFERSDSLLIAWGDCLMSLLVRDSTSNSTSTAKDGGPPKAKRKTVEASMAWELDCVACDVLPVDDKHVAVLGLVPSPDIEGSNHQYGNSDYSVAGGDNTLELQIINRIDGKSISNDRLPLSEGAIYQQHQGGNNNRITTANATEFRLLSSFACSRMDISAEWDALDDTEKEARGRESTSERDLRDLHLIWDLDTDICSSGKEIQAEASIYDDAQSASSDRSICSDNYVFPLSEPIGDILDSASIKSPPPIMTVVYSYDACLVQTRDVDDAISYTRSLRKPALALRKALAHRVTMRRHGLELLIDDFFIALLRMGSRGKGRPLSISRLKIAVESLPILLGGDARMWQRWIFMFSRIPGGLFAIREKIPVRDPELPSFVFEMSLEKLLEETLYQGLDENEPQEEKPVGETMADLLLETLRSWGPTSALRRRIQLQRYFAQNQQWGLQWKSGCSTAITSFIQQAERDLQRRISQTAFGVLANANYSSSLVGNSIRQYIDSSKDSLFDVDHLIAQLTTRFQLSDAKGDRDSTADNDQSSNIVIGQVSDNSTVVVEYMAELELMRERYDRALGYYLAIGSHFMIDSFPQVETSAVQCVNSYFQDSLPEEQDKIESNKYFHILSMIELHELSHVLLKRNYSFVDKKGDSKAESPIVALIMLVGLSRSGRFLIDNCSPPEGTQASSDDTEGTFGRSNLPLDLIVTQLESRPKLLYWFLFQVFIHKAEWYAKFPTTAVPPVAITEIHRLQLSLFLDYAIENNQNDESSKPPALLMANNDTPFMVFLRTILPFGGVQADNVREQLETYRSRSVDSSVFARELAFVIEKFGSDTINDAKEVLQLYVQGAKNLHMAVAFAERNTKYSSTLWDILVEHCTKVDPNSNDDAEQGALFGSLLEAAAHTGADLASLVARIPEGMSIEGLRPKLIAAISDYRYKVKIHELVDNILLDDKVSILREISHLSRRGQRMSCDDFRTANEVERGLPSGPSILRKSRMKALPNSETSFSLPIR